MAVWRPREQTRQRLQAVMGPSNLGLAEGMHYCAQLRYMMVVCREGTTQEQLESLAPDYRTLKERTLSCAVLGVLVTAVGRSSATSCSLCAAGNATGLTRGHFYGPSGLEVMALCISQLGGMHSMAG